MYLVAFAFEAVPGEVIEMSSMKQGPKGKVWPAGSDSEDLQNGDYGT